MSTEDNFNRTPKDKTREWVKKPPTMLYKTSETTGSSRPRSARYIAKYRQNCTMHLRWTASLEPKKRLYQIETTTVSSLFIGFGSSCCLINKAMFDGSERIPM
jgi:hypothetical protein